jgi:carboxyl-terminal processing protease
VVIQKKKLVMYEDRILWESEPFADGYIGKIFLKSFYDGGSGDGSDAGIRQALADLRQKGPLYGLVIDLRHNAGGVLTQAVKVAGLFMAPGVVVVAQYSTFQESPAQETRYLRHLDGRTPYTGPVVLLTSKRSASAAEILAKVLQDYGLVIVAGDVRTFGKGTIQQQTVMAETPPFVAITVGRYYTPSGDSPQITGMHPDILVPTQYSLQRIGEKYLPYPLRKETISPVYIDPMNDIPPHYRPWFRDHYIPHMQKKLSKWNSHLSLLRKNSEQRLLANKNFQAFLNHSDSPQMSQMGMGWGAEDIQMQEAVCIVKDMASLHTD